VKPGDFVMTDVNSVAVIPVKKAEEVFNADREILKSELAIVGYIKNDRCSLRLAESQVMTKY